MSTNFHLLFINYAEPHTSDIVRNSQHLFSSAKDKHEYKQREYFTADDKAIYEGERLPTPPMATPRFISLHLGEQVFPWIT